MQRRWPRRLLLVLVALLFVLFLVEPVKAQTPLAHRVLVATLANDINPVTQDYLLDQVSRAEQDYDALVVELDTPGGLDSSMRAIIQRFLAAKVPVIVYVAPPGARAASAGMFITLAADVAAMAPQTNIGSSTPVSTGGEDIPKDLKNKVINDAAAYARALAEEHGRNADWAESAVREAANVDARRALELGVVDLVAQDLADLLRQADGRELKTKDLPVQTAGASIDRVSMSTWQQILDFLIDPNLIVLFLSVGLLGIVVELWNPGLIFPGTVGAVSLILGLFGLQVLPISWAGLLLMILALAFFAAEPFIVSHGALTAAGGVCFVLGSLLLFDPAGDAYQVSIWVALAVAATMGFMALFVLAKLVQVRRRPPTTGASALVGQVALVREPLDPGGWVSLDGARWHAHVADGERPVASGESAVVVAVEGLELVVAPEPGADEADD